ncbi:MAG: hypothetical protein ABGF52_10320 [Candidatus Asgardarchaeum sp.]
MRRTISSLFLLFLILTLFSTSLLMTNMKVHVKAAIPPVDFEIENVVWGTPQNYPISVSPGDTNVPLTIFVRNLSNNTLRGVRGTLNLSYPFKDYVTESYTAEATAQPVEQGNVLNQTGDILEMGSFTLTFNLNIDPNATKGVYYYNLTLTYFVSVGNVFVAGEPRVYLIPIRIYNRAPVIYSVNPTSGTVDVLIGETVNFTVNKCKDPDNDTLNYEWYFDGDLVLENSTTYIYTALEEDVGSHTLEFRASDGNLTTSWTWAINVMREVKTTVKVSNQYVTVGLVNTINFTISNNIWHGRVDVSYTVPNPLVIYGNNSWTFYNITPDDIIVVTVSVYVPFGAYGNTFPTQIGLSYSDDYGNEYTETYSVGLVTRGYIRIVVYEKSVIPTPVKPGEKVAFSATILNKGNIGAIFTNVSIISNDILELTPESVTYIGDVDANSPVPFTVYAYVKSDVNNGTYPILIKIYYEDDLFNGYSLNVTFLLTVLKVTNTENETQSTTIDLYEVLYRGGWTVIIGGIAVIVFAIVYSKKKLKQLESSSLI